MKLLEVVIYTHHLSLFTKIQLSNFIAIQILIIELRDSEVIHSASYMYLIIALFEQHQCQAKTLNKVIDWTR